MQTPAMVKATNEIALFMRVVSGQRPKLSDPAHEGVGLQLDGDGRVRCAWLGGTVILFWREDSRMTTRQARSSSHRESKWERASKHQREGCQRRCQRWPRPQGQ